MVFARLLPWTTRADPPPPAPPLDVEFVTLLTCHDTAVGFSRSDGVLFHSDQPAGPARGELAACWFPSHPGALFLFDASAEARPLQWSGTGWRAPILALRVGQTDQAGRFFLCHPLTGRHLSAEGPPDGTGALSMNRTEVGPWEVFAVQPASSVQPGLAPGPRLRAVAAALAAMLACAEEAGLVGMLGLAAQPDGSFAAVAALQPLSAMEQFARRLACEPALAQALAAACPSDPWATQALPALARHQSGTAAGQPTRAVDADLDGLAQAGFDGRYVSWAQACNGLARGSVVPQRGVCIVATCRNEGPYLLEWLAYHIGVGIEHVFLYSNDNQDGSDQLLQALARAGVITWISNVVGLGTSPQYKAYGHAMQVLPDVLDYRWAMVIDVDEFFVFHPVMFRSITDYLRWQETQPVDSIGLSWLNYGPSGQARLTNQPVHRRFSQRQPQVDRHVKSLFRPQRFIHAQCHYPVWEADTVLQFRCSDRRSHPQQREQDASAFSPHPRAEFGWINHYIMKSAEEFALRRSNLRADVPSTALPPLSVFTAEHVQWFRSFYDQADVTDTRAEACCPEFDRHLARLKGLPGVAEACRAVEQATEQRRSSLRRLLQDSGRFTAPGTHEGWFGSLLGLEERVPARSPG